jgi:hypothetical protein
MEFAAVLQVRQQRIAKHANTQRVPGLAPDDVAQELTACLWRAFTTFTGEYSESRFNKYWWSIWLNRKADLIDHFFAGKRAAEITHLEPEELEALAPLVTVRDVVPCPSSDPVARAAWFMLQEGYQAQEVRKVLEISLRKFYGIIASWRCPEVRELLVG